ncbi:MAG: NADPH-dependent glutamate synthase beta subunit-like oxidoreductase [Arenicella sp.]|jgi:NADPH-dependent glutamate synthase beta subunit-like oxidoreductase
MKATDISNPEYFHKVVDCQYACPAHTPVPEYIRLIGQRRYSDAYMVNWESNVFPGILGRTCDRPCEPACRRGRVDEEPVAICRLKRVAADNKDDAEVSARMPLIPSLKNGKKIALIGAGPASLTVARDLMPLGYEVDLYDENSKGGGFMRSQIPSFRLPENVLDQEVDYVLDMGVTRHFNTRVESMKSILDKGYDAVFVGTGAPKAKDLMIPGRDQAQANIHLGINWLESVAFEHLDSIGSKVIIVGGGNTAMDCCRTAKRIGGKEVSVTVRSTYETMKASPWEKDDTLAEGIPILANHSPREFILENGKLVAMTFNIVASSYDENGRRTIKETGEIVTIECSDAIMAIGQDNAFPWIERDVGIEFGEWDMPIVDKVSFQSTNQKIFFGGDAAFGPENVITAVAHGHQAAISIDLFLNGSSVKEARPAPGTNLVSSKMGIHQWSYDSAVVDDDRQASGHIPVEQALSSRKIESEIGFDLDAAFIEAERCLNCDVQTVFFEKKCIECDGCTDICPTNCITFTNNDEEGSLRNKLNAPSINKEQDLYVSTDLPTGRVMVKDEDMCLHCGLCAERCPTSAWDMQQFLYTVTKAGNEPAPILVEQMSRKKQEQAA